MSSYVVTGASRGIGLEYVRQLSAIPDNKVFALVRSKKTADKLTPLEGGNLHVLEADVTDHKALKVAAAKVAEVTGGTLDVLINNAAAIAGNEDWRCLTDFIGEEDLLDQEFEYTFKVNVVGVIHSTNAFLPLIQKGSTKKIVTISSLGGYPDFVFKTNLVGMTAYGASKAAANLVVTKYAAQFRDKGLIFVLLHPGLVDTSATSAPPSAKMVEWLSDCIATFMKTSPGFTGPSSPAESVRKQLKLIAEATPKDNGSLLHVE